MDCPNCGAQVPQGSSSCPACGVALGAGVSAGATTEVLIPPGTERFAALDPVDDVIASTKHGFSDNDQVVFGALPGERFPRGLGQDHPYFVRDARADTFRVSGVQGGSPTDITTTGTGYVRKVADAPKSHWLAIGLAVAGIALALGFAVFGLTRQATVPTVLGLTTAEAQTKVTDAKLHFQEAGTVYSTTYPEGTVAVQTPDPGQKVDKDTTVYVQLATAKKDVSVPNLVGTPVLEASRALDKAGLLLAPVKTVKSDKPLGQVLEQTPAAGTNVQIGSEVTLTVSQGQEQPAQVAVPSLIGMQKDVAQSVLHALGLEIATQEVESSQPKGEVVSQDPGSGTKVDVGATVTLGVSNGASTTTTTAAPTTTTTTAAPTTTTKAPTTTLPPTTAAPTTTKPPTTLAPTTTAAPTTLPPTTATTTSVLLYEADWSSGLNGWQGGAGWTTQDGTLVNNGATSIGTGAPDGILAPYKPQVADYAVVAVMQALPTKQPKGSVTQAGGLVMRLASDGGYVLGISPAADGVYLFIANPAKGESAKDHVLGSRTVQLGTGYHTFRGEVNGSTVKLSVDSRDAVKVTDGRFTAPGQLAIWASGTGIQVRSFKVYRVQ